MPLLTCSMIPPSAETWEDPLTEVSSGVAGPLCCPKGAEETKMPADRDSLALK